MYDIINLIMDMEGILMPTTKEMERLMDVDNKKNFSSPYHYIKSVCEAHGQLNALDDNYTNIKMTFKEFGQAVNNFAIGLQTLEITKGDKVAVFSENHARWMIIDQAIMAVGAVSAVRGSNAPVGELNYILTHSDAVGVIVRDGILFKKLLPSLNDLNLKFVIIMLPEENENYENSNIPVYTYNQIIEKGQNADFTPVEITENDDATLIYTSGTTNQPKGVLLTHGNIKSQVENLHPPLQAQTGKTLLSVLPIWHAYERTCEYYYFSRGCKLAYTNIKSIKSDMQKYKADYIVAVPRIWESIYKNLMNSISNKSKILSKILNFALKISYLHKKSLRYLNRADIYTKNYNIIGDTYKLIMYYLTMPFHKLFKKIFYEKLKAQLGLTFKYVISGGGALSSTYEDFFEALELTLIVGYGLTETAPVLALRWILQPNYIYSTGTMLPKTEVKIINPTTNEILKPYEKGLVMVKGPQVMKEYYKNEEATKAVITEDKWFNTGDLGYLTDKHVLVLSGRMKETIVLSNGENVEPIGIEDACYESIFINQIMIVGQDRTVIGALIVPSSAAYQKFAKNDKINDVDKDRIIKSEEFKDFMKREITAKVKSKPHIRSFERITKFAFIREEFSTANGLLTQTSKIKRNNVAEKYADLIEKMYK